MSHWLMPDIGRPNIPPTIRLISPAEGDQFTGETPIVLRAEASDPDGTVVRVVTRGQAVGRSKLEHAAVRRVIRTTIGWQRASGGAM